MYLLKVLKLILKNGDFLLVEIWKERGKKGGQETKYVGTLSKDILLN